MSALAMAPAQYTFGQPSFAGALLARQTFVDPSNSHQYELVRVEDVALLNTLEDRMLALTAELVRTHAGPQDFESWDKVKADLDL